MQNNIKNRNYLCDFGLSLSLNFLREAAYFGVFVDLHISGMRKWRIYDVPSGGMRRE